MDEILLLQEFEETDEVSMLAWALPVGEMDVAGDVVRESQCFSALRAGQYLRNWRLRRG